MYRLILTILAALLFAVFCSAQDCKWCDCGIDEGVEKVRWGQHVFCGEDCRHEWYLDNYRCKICNEKVVPKSHATTRTDGMFIYMDFSPKTWDGYCEGCREGVKDGQIDPVKDRYREEIELDPSAAAAARGAPGGETRPAQTRTPEADDSGDFVFGILKWVVGIGVVFVFIFRKLMS